MSNHTGSNDQVFNAVYALIEWAYDLRLDAEDRATFEAEVFQGWNNADDSDQDFIAYLLQLKEALWSAPHSRRKQAKPQTRLLFRKMFGIRESNDRGRLVTVLHSIIERRSPGISGVAGAALLPAPLRGAPQLHVPVQATPVTHVQPVMQPQAIAIPAQNPAAHSAAQGADSYMDILRETQRRAQMVGLQSAIAKTEHESIMNVIKNM